MTPWETKRHYKVAYLNEFLDSDNFYGDGAVGEARRDTDYSEYDFGVWWTGPDPMPRYRVTWVEKTGEVYVENLTEGSVEVIASGMDWQQIDAAMRGWEDQIYEPNSLAWVRLGLAPFPLAELDG